MAGSLELYVDLTTHKGIAVTPVPNENFIVYKYEFRMLVFMNFHWYHFSDIILLYVCI